MQFAFFNNEKILPTPNFYKDKKLNNLILDPNDKLNTPICPICKSPVIPKCRDINIHHWAHENNLECDSFWEPETQWHRNWKNLFPKEQQEITIGKHRADILKNDGTIIELQHSSISTKHILEREQEYKKMIWLFDGRDLADEIFSNSNNEPIRLDLRPKNDIHTFRWKHARESYAYCEKDVFIDLGFYIFLMHKIYLGPPCGGWGIIIHPDEFTKWLLE